ncbi:hypothetical protein Cs7R123_46520 [Catellatospora sp. TT07R-123]|nr:hypothetical protein Cs7R123_46520 [Catellatospora sp. TT07R-123]
MQPGAEGDQALLMHEVENGLRKGHDYQRSQRPKPDNVRRWESEAAVQPPLGGTDGQANRRVTTSKGA